LDDPPDPDPEAEPDELLFSPTSFVEELECVGVPASFP